MELSYYSRNKEKRNKYYRDKYKINREEILKERKKYYQKHRKKIITIVRKSQNKDVDAHRKKSRDWYHNNPLKRKLSREQNREKIRLSRLQYALKGGAPDQIQRHSKENYKWRRAIFKRDNYTCQNCSDTNCMVFAHHIKSWKHYPELRFELSNGITLCKVCHKEADKSHSSTSVTSSSTEISRAASLAFSHLNLASAASSVIHAQARIPKSDVQG